MEFPVALSARSTGTVPLRTSFRGQGTVNGRLENGMGGRPSTSIELATTYQPEAREHARSLAALTYRLGKRGGYPTDHTEAVSGLMNLVMLPMWILSGTFFSYSRFPDAMIPFVKALPLTALNDALRAVMIDGAAVTTLGTPLAIVVAWGAVSFVIALKIFRWR